MNGLDKIDRTILDIVQHEGRISNVDLAKRVHLSAAATHTRLRRLEREAYIEGYMARINREKLGYHMLCYVHISLQTHSSEQLEKFRRTLKQMPQVLECSFITGEFDYIVKVVLRDQQDLERFILKELAPIPGVARVNTSLVVKEVKSTSALPVSEAEKPPV